jgi:archaellum component FlaF (FlaF/FlaG flagellin family)
MSSNAAAIRRRVNPQQQPKPVNTQIPQSPSNSNPTPQSPSINKQLTIQQVITTMDQRLKQVETIMQNNGTNNSTSDLSLIVDEFNNRFELIVTEMNSLKDIVMQLQTYTMSVNKTLYDERINILSDLGNNAITPSDNKELQSGSNSQDNLEQIGITHHNNE